MKVRHRGVVKRDGRVEAREGTECVQSGCASRYDLSDSVTESSCYVLFDAGEYQVRPVRFKLAIIKGPHAILFITSVRSSPSDGPV